MRIVYIILAHNHPKQVRRLIKRLAAPEVSFVIHLDKKMSWFGYWSLKRYVANIDRVFFTTKRVRVYWGTMSVVDATLHAIDTALEYVADFDYALLVSGTHYPIKTNQQILSHLETHRGKIFFDHTVVPSTDRWHNVQGGLNRIKYRFYFRGKGYETRKEIVHGLFRPYIPGEKRLLEGFDIYGGGQWWTLSKESLVYARDFLKRNPSFLEFFRYKIDIPDEMFFQTLFLNSLYKDLVISDNLTYIEWSKKDACHPKILTVEDFKQISESTAFFARKFVGDKSLHILDRIDRELLQHSHD